MLNISLFFQVAHFFIAYALIDTFFLKRIVAFIQEEKQIQESLVNVIEQERLTIYRKEQEKTQEWAAFRDSIRSLVPAISYEEQKMSSVQEPIIKKEVSEQEKVKAKKELQSALMMWVIKS